MAEATRQMATNTSIARGYHAFPHDEVVRRWSLKALVHSRCISCIRPCRPLAAAAPPEVP